jgi:hypothetical protein
LKVLWLLLIFLTLTFHLTEAIGKEGGNEEPKGYITYSLSAPEDNPRLIKELKPGEILLPGDYNIEAQLSLKSDKVEVELESLNFEPVEGNRLSNEKLQQGWTSIDKTYFWKPESEKNILTIPLSPKSYDQLPSIPNFDQLQLDFNDLSSKNTSLLSLKLDVEWGESGKNQTTAIIVGKQLVSLKSFHLPSVLWKEKGFSYLAKRTFGLTHDSSWNFISKKKYFFYQNRFHINLNDVETINIHFKPNTSLKKITSLSCNLRIGYETLLAPAKIIECARFPKNIFRSNGHLVLRIWVGGMLRAISENKSNGFLEELIFRIDKKQLKNIQEQPINSVHFRSFFQPNIPNNNTISKVTEKQGPKDQIFHFQTPVITLSPKRKRLIFPLDLLGGKTGGTGKIKNISLSIQPMHWDVPSNFLLQRLRLVSHGREQHSEIFNLGKKLSTRWGGPILDQEINTENIEWVEVRNFFSFTSPTIYQKKKPTTYLKEQRKRLSSFKTTPYLIDFKGIHIHAQKEISEWTTNNDGLRLQGKGDWIEIDWPVHKDFDKNSWFFMRFGEGKENILDLKVIPLTENRELSPITITPNKPERLIGITEEVKKLKIKVFLFSSPFILQLKEIVVFQPLLLKLSNILETPMLFEEETLLIPKNIQTRPKQKVTVFKSHISANSWPQSEGVLNELSWETEIGKKINQVKGLKVMYKVPSTMHINNPCWLQFTLVSTNYKVKKSICSEISTNEVIFPIEQLFHGINFKYDEKLRYISWKILAKGKTHPNDHPLPIDVAISLIGYDIQTYLSDLLSHPVMELDETALFPISLDGVSTENIYPHNFATHLGTVSIKDEGQDIPRFNFLDHPHFQIKKFSLIKKEPISIDEWEFLTKKDSKNNSESENLIDAHHEPIPLRIIFFFILAGALWWGWKQQESLLSLKWLVQISPELAHKQIKVWLYVAAGHYLIGLTLGLFGKHTIEVIFLTLGCISILLAWHSFVWKIRPDLEFNYPDIVTLVYDRASGPYFSGFILTLVVSALFLIIRVAPVAEQISAVGYFMLVVGVIIEFKTLGKEYQENKEEKKSIDTKPGTTVT